jgi:hypothetical protein
MGRGDTIASEPLAPPFLDIVYVGQPALRIFDALGVGKNLAGFQILGKDHFSFVSTIFGRIALPRYSTGATLKNSVKAFENWYRLA